MTRRVTFGLTTGMLLLQPGIHAQTAVPDRQAASGSTYIDRAAGLTLSAAVAQALEQEPSLRATRSRIEVARG